MDVLGSNPAKYLQIVCLCVRKDRAGERRRLRATVVGSVVVSVVVGSVVGERSSTGERIR